VLIDWFTIIAQIINFLILLFLLRRFLYRPILNAMEAREQRVANLLSEAEEKRVAAEHERARFEAKNQELQETYEQRKADIESSVEKWRKDALHEARQEVDKTKQNWYRTLEDDKEVFFNELNQLTVRQTFTVASRAVSDLANVNLETMMVTTFLEKLRSQELNFDHLSNNATSPDESTLKLRSAFNLAPELQSQFEKHLQKQLNNKVRLQFEVEPNLISGIELVWESGYAAAWNLRRYLESLQDEIDQQMNETMGERSFAQGEVEV
jgi:F-type H+-transporting ATPase subunit b